MSIHAQEKVRTQTGEYSNLKITIFYFRANNEFEPGTDDYGYIVQARDGNQTCSVYGTTSIFGRKEFSVATNQAW